MVTKQFTETIQGGASGAALQYSTYFGLSIDSKPTTGVGNGSAFVEMDTSKIYFYDAAGSQWLEWAYE